MVREFVYKFLSPIRTEMKSRILILCLLMSLGGCGGNYYSRDRYYGSDSVDVDDLLRFQASFADKSPVARAEECRRMLKYQKQSPKPDWILRLMIGRPLSESCGEPAWLVRKFEALRSKRYLGRMTEGLANYQIKVLQRLCSSGRTEKDETTIKPSKNDAKLLRDKLEAIRTMEKAMDERKAGEH